MFRLDVQYWNAVISTQYDFETKHDRDEFIRITGDATCADGQPIIQKITFHKESK